MEAENDLNMAFIHNEQEGSDYAVAEYIKAQGYVSVEDFKIVK